MPVYKNYFGSPDHIEETIYDANDKVVGTIRIKPSGVLWKPKGKGKYFRKSLEDFAAWITDPQTKATKVKQ